MKIDRYEGEVCVTVIFPNSLQCGQVVGSKDSTSLSKNQEY